MPGRHSRLLFLIAFALSLSVHVVLLAFVPLHTRGAVGNAQEQEFSVYLEPPPPDPPKDEIKEAPTPPPPEVMLGLNAPLPPSLNWLGFTERVPQAAPLASTEQAAFTDEPVAAAPRESTAPPEPLPSPPVDDVPPQPSDQHPPEPLPLDEPPPEVTPPNQSPSTSDTPPPDAMPNPAPEESLQDDVPKEKPEPADVNLERADENRNRPFASMFLDMIDQLIQRQADQAIAHETATQKGDSESPKSMKDVNDLETQSPLPAPNKASPTAATSQPVASPAAPRSNKPVASQPRPGADNQGMPADKHSQATSMIEIPRENWSLGKPLAGKGLELKPRKPTFTLLTLMTAAPGNPLCELSFDREGVVKRARIIKSSGDSRIDEGILNSLYYWRAAGEELEKLQTGDLLDIQMRIMLTRRSE